MAGRRVARGPSPGSAAAGRGRGRQMGCCGPLRGRALERRWRSSRSRGITAIIFRPPPRCQRAGTGPANAYRDVSRFPWLRRTPTGVRPGLSRVQPARAWVSGNRRSLPFVPARRVGRQPRAWAGTASAQLNPAVFAGGRGIRGAGSEARRGHAARPCSTASSLELGVPGRRPTGSGLVVSGRARLGLPAPPRISPPPGPARFGPGGPKASS